MIAPDRGPPASGEDRRATRRLRRVPRRGAYLLPSLFTIGNMLLGFYAVVTGLRGDFTRAALLVFTAAVLDSLDGWIARLTGTESEFGKEYDSLADVVTFGAVPALLAYLWGFAGDGEWQRVGWLAPLFFLVCTATRLARFNVQKKIVDARWFVGLPTPAAAGAICSILFFAPDPEWRPWIEALMLAALVLVGALMVSTIRYRSPKQLDPRRRWSYRVLLPVAAVVLVLALHPPATFLVLSVLYTLSGPLAYLAGKLRRRPAPPAFAPAEAAEAPALPPPPETP
jgi:CDP-diacylglycerol--serine O-phosphatidyltransferase